jgi:acylaminoacyl-peptidase
MRRSIWVAAAAALWLSASGATSARPFTAKDLAMLDRVSSPKISPDGRYVAYVLRSTDWDANRGLNALNVIDLQGDPSKPLALVTGEKGGPSPAWSADGRWLYYISSKSGSSQVWRSTANGSVRQQLTAFPVDVGGFAVSPDGRTLAAAVDVYADCPTIACTKERDDANGKQKSSGILVKSGESRNWDSYEDEKYGALYRVDLTQPGAPAEAARIVNAFTADLPSDSGGLAIGRDSRTIYFASTDPAVEPLGRDAYSRIYQAPMDGSAAPRVLLGRPGASFSAPSISPDGKQLAYLVNTSPPTSYGRTALMVMDLRSGRTRQLAQNLDVVINALGWSADGRSILATAEDNAQVPLSRVDLATGQVARLTSTGQVSAFDSARGTVVYVRESLDSPQQLFVQQAGGPARQLTHAGAATLAQTPLSPSEQFSFPGWNGETVHGYVTKPYGFTEGRKYPVAFLIHGGPQSSFGNAWSYRWNPQVWAGMGYAVVSINFHGSSGYGDQFAQSIIGHWGDRPLEDLQKGWSYALSRYSYLDGNRACALGGSYGGYMIAWIAGQWSQPWKCLVDHAGVFDIRSMAWTMDATSFIEDQFGSVKDIAEWERANPAAYADRWKVPILVIHGGRDFRVPTEQGIAAHNAARRAGVPTQLLIFPDENHWVLKPQNSVQWYRAVEDWLDRWTGEPANPSQPATAATR